MAAGLVDTGSGRVQGVERRGVWSFAGIPYAAPPAGPRRWRPPIAPEPWAGIRDCSAFGPIAPQVPGIVEMTLTGDATVQAEDCVSLNVWTPGLDDGRRPVMVWIHGGSFLSGSGSGILYRGGLLSREQDVVVVTVNYRLGPLGFLAHPALADDGQPWLDGRPWTGVGNWGLADQVAALHWVHQNISGFGGDPGNVTLFGESAGGMSVATLMAAPVARGLFHRAVVQSGPPYTHSVEWASELTEKMIRHLGVDCTRQELERVSADRLVAGFADFAAQPGRSEDAGLLLRPVVGEGMVPTEPEEAVAVGAAADLPLAIGTTRDETAFFAVGDERLRGIDEVGLRRWLRRLSTDPGSIDDLISTVTAARKSRGEPTSPPDLWVAISSEFIFRVPTYRFAASHAAAANPGVGTYGYLFTWESPAFGGVLGACHALELPFVFGSVHHPAVQAFSGSDDRAFALSAAMRASWAAFARSGDPQGDGLLTATGPGVGVAGQATGQSAGHGARGGPGAAAPWTGWDPTRRPTTVLGPWPEDELLARVVDDPRHDEVDATATVMERAGVPRR
jgi:para-nitrobenzyl esterase